MNLEVLPEALTVCKLKSLEGVNMPEGLFFLGITDDEVSLVCKTGSVPDNTLEREDGWRCFRVAGILDFSLIGILARISTVLAEHKIGLFVVSTFNTDYILVKNDDLTAALKYLEQAGYEIRE